MTVHHQPPQEQRHPDLSLRRADITVRIVLWIVVGLIVLSPTFRWFWT